ncbi:type II toxin-antitoxin system Phd/YefM family antitoxin [Salinispira pacifica]|uniref:Antitoxin n=1 Tax=Salinispira pacifica TaxID=1307761 RepID=V5WKW4_9SPIO|nr:type II toxin-antitoxin system Phd/YefM family antitoxin [Salinispira pacifica]AHC16467.1 hypothetical protein L21SP2_3125 [Salinispira pacifica]
MLHISANELKTKGASAIKLNDTEDSEAIITVRGKDTYVVMSLEKYNYLRECELEAALNETRKDLDSGNMYTDGISAHLNRIDHA